jgi:hypothetical protein
MDAEDIVQKVTAYAAPLVEYFKNASSDEIKNFRSNQALDGVKKNCLGMMAIISESDPTFTNPELKQYLGSRDKEGTKIARELITEINLAIHNDVINQLKKSYGDSWWIKVPLSTRKKCDEQWNNDNGAKERWQYLSLIDYHGIVMNHWEAFEDRYSFGDKGKKSDKLAWIVEINRIRQTTAHPEKGLLSKDEVAYVKEIRARVAEKIAGASL